MKELPQLLQTHPQPHLQPHPARLGWMMDRSCYIHDDQRENPARIAQVLKIVPKLPWLLELNEETVFDLAFLVKSIEAPCVEFLLTCSCGDAEDALIDGDIEVLHPTPDAIVWRFEVERWKNYLDPQLAQQDSGWVAVVFDRAEYVADIRAMLSAVQSAHAQLPLYRLEPNEFEIDEVAQLLQRLDAAHHYLS